MIVFDLQCGNAHIFEAWFGTSADYASQNRRKLIACPVCNDTSIKKAMMAPNIAAKGNRKSGLPAVVRAAEDSATPVANTPDTLPATLPAALPGTLPPPAEMKRMMELMAEFQSKIETSHENVGDTFPEEARKIHYGESEPKLIYGEATPAEAAELQEEGIDILPLPFQKRRNKRLDA
jgi:hypothetical protein